MNIDVNVYRKTQVPDDATWLDVLAQKAKDEFRRLRAIEMIATNIAEVVATVDEQDGQVN